MLADNKSYNNGINSIINGISNPANKLKEYNIGYINKFTEGKSSYIKEFYISFIQKHIQKFVLYIYDRKLNF